MKPNVYFHFENKQVTVYLVEANQEVILAAFTERDWECLVDSIKQDYPATPPVGSSSFHEESYRKGFMDGVKIGKVLG